MLINTWQIVKTANYSTIGRERIEERRKNDRLKKVRYACMIEVIQHIVMHDELKMRSLSLTLKTIKPWSECQRTGGTRV